jgi:FlaG/FlaF family flagellin (archaellin)
MVKVTPTSLAFAALKVGATSAAKTVTINNVGPDVLSISGITITGPNPGDFSETTTCGATLGVNGSCTIAVRFVPTAIGSRAATLNVGDSDPTSPELVNLTGTGQ